MFIEINRGRSFRGLSQYCLHDVDADTSDRVDFVETRNVATDNPQAAWRIMASRAYVQDELKEKAGVRSSGRKNGKPVGHMLISWGRDEADAQDLGREQMVKAAEGALKAIGADKHQAMIVAHNDTADKSPHCHVIINLIGDDGRLKKNWKEHEKLSLFALKEEIRIHGEPIVSERHKRWHDREAGETPAPMKKKARHLYELEKAAEQDNSHAKNAERLLAQQGEIERQKNEQEARHIRNRERLRNIKEERERRAKAQHEALIRRARTNARKLYTEPWRCLHTDQRHERNQFNQNEKGIRGSIENGLRLVDWFKLFERPKDSGKDSLKDLFQILTSEAKRREVLMHQQDRQRRALRNEQQKAERDAITIAKQLRDQRLQEVQKDYVIKAERMKERQHRAKGRLKETQQRITSERNQALKQYRVQELDRKRKLTLQQKLHRDFDDAAKPEEEMVKDDTDRTEAGGNSVQTVARPKRKRKPRDPNKSRRKRNIDKPELGDNTDSQVRRDPQSADRFADRLDRDHDFDR